MSRIVKGLSYVLCETDKSNNHILAVNSLEYSAIHNTLFSAGRDGVVKAWNPSVSSIDPEVPPALNKANLLSDDGSARIANARRAATNDVDFDDDEEEQLVKLEVEIQGKSLGYEKPGAQGFQKLAYNYQLHSDWINDLKLVDNDKQFVTCSSDLSIKLTNIDTKQTTKFINQHGDYIKKMSYNSRENVIISGGLDRKIVLWDLNTLKPITNYVNQDELGSIYSLANNGNMICSGSPNNLIDLYDNRLNTKIRSLIGHQDNIRSLLINDNFILSGSSDSTIKIWDLKTFKVFKNLDIHDFSVWSLYSNDPELKTFYSGDKSGAIIKTDLSYLITTDDTAETSVVNENIGVSTLIANDNPGIIAICEGDNSLWSANLTSINRYQVPDTSKLAEYQYYKNLHFARNAMDEDDEDNLYDLVSQFSVDTDVSISQQQQQQQQQGNPPFDSLPASPLPIPLSVTVSPPTNMDGVFMDKLGLEEDGELFDSMFLSLNGGPSPEFICNPIEENSKQQSQNIDLSTVEILSEPIPPNLIYLKPFNVEPLEISPLEPSVVLKRLLNNKRMALSLSNNGDIKLWDLLTCRAVKTFKNTKAQKYEERINYYESVVDEYQTNEVLPNWCNLEIRSGRLVVSITKNNYNNVEIFHDDLVENYPAISQVEGGKNDDRYNVGEILLRSIFTNYAEYEIALDKEFREKIKELKKSKKFVSSSDASSTMTSVAGSQTTANTNAATNDSDKKPGFGKKLFGRKSSRSVPTLAKPEPSEPNLTHTTTSSSGDSVNEAADLDAVAFLLQQVKKKYEEQSASQLSDSLLNVTSTLTPKVPVISLPPDVQIMITESSSDLGNLRELFSFMVKETSALDEKKVVEYRKNIPIWIGNPVLMNKYTIKDLPKIGFILEEYGKPENGSINGNSNSNGKVKGGLPQMENGSRLNSHNMLRVKKILSYVTERFDSKTAEMKESKLPEEWLELLCNGEVLPINMTLSTVRTKVWKSSSDIVLQYRRKVVV